MRRDLQGVKIYCHLLSEPVPSLNPFFSYYEHPPYYIWSLKKKYKLHITIIYKKKSSKRCSINRNIEKREIKKEEILEKLSTLNLNWLMGDSSEIRRNEKDKKWNQREKLSFWAPLFLLY